MRLSTALTAAVAALPAVTIAHGIEGAPQLFGRRSVAELRARNVFGARTAEVLGSRSVEVDHHPEHAAQGKRQEGECGAGLGSCPAGQCCSPSGYCGTTSDYCYSPGCQYQYGPGCPENQTPAGANTSTIARPLNGNVEYGGVGIYDCVVPGTMAITYDDGPYIYTDHVLDVLESYGAKATFFITGNNLAKGEIDINASYVSTIQRMYSAGHQIASHTWTHLDLSAISSADRHEQMWKNEMALRNILGFFPAYMRPPYSSCTAASGCEADLKALGYHITYFDVDTDDYDQDSPNLIQNSKNWFYGNITANGATSANSDWLVIGHDIHQQTAYNLTDYMLSTLQGMGYTAVTVGECLGDPIENWYRADGVTPSGTSTASTSAPTSTSTLKATTDGSCGSTAGTTCAGTTFGTCCSQYGYCGSTDAYCGTGCQSGFGSCTSNSITTSAASVSSASASASSASSVVAGSSTTVSSAGATSTSKVSTDATCGGTSGFTCQGSTFGNCCSVNGWCGSTDVYCGTGCQTGFGSCTGGASSSVAVAASSSIKAVSSSVAPASSSVKASSSSIKVASSSVKPVSSSIVTSTVKVTSTAKVSSAAPATSTLKASTDGTCGTGKATCKGSTFGTCCSQYGYCGSTTTYCGTGCQKGFGTCT